MSHGYDVSGNRLRNALMDEARDIVEGQVKLTRAYLEMKKQRDELLTACRAVLCWQDRNGGFCEPEDERDVMVPLRAAVSKAEGK